GPHFSRLRAIAIPLRESTPSGGPEHFNDHRSSIVTAPAGSPKPRALAFSRRKSCGGRWVPPTAAPLSHKERETEDIKPLDKVDFGRQVARDFETNFLLANCGLRPNFHGVSSKAVNCFHHCKPRRGPTRLVQTLVVHAQSADRPIKVKTAPCCC